MSLAADILVIAGPIWLGDNSSVTKRVIERLYDNSSLLLRPPMNAIVSGSHRVELAVSATNGCAPPGHGQWQAAEYPWGTCGRW